MPALPDRSRQGLALGPPVTMEPLIFGVDAPEGNVQAPVGTWYVQTRLPPQSDLVFWLKASGSDVTGWSLAPRPPVISTLRDLGGRPDSGEDAGPALQRAVALGRPIFLAPGVWRLKSPHVRIAACEVFRSPLVIFGIPGATTIQCTAGPIQGSGGRDVSWLALSCSDADACTLHGLTIDGGVGKGAGWVTSGAAADQAAAIEIRNTAVVQISYVTFTRFRGSAPKVPDADIPERAKQGPLFLRSCGEVRLDRCSLAPPTFTEGIIAIDCGAVTVDSFEASLSGPGATAGTDLSTPLHIYGPDTGAISITNSTFVGHLGSAMNLGGAGPVLVRGNRVRGADLQALRLSGGIDLSDELVCLGWASIPVLHDVQIIQNVLQGIDGAAIKVGGGAPTFTVKGVTVRRTAGTVEATFASPPALVPGQRIRVSENGGFAGEAVVGSVDRTLRTARWPQAGPDTASSTATVAAIGLAGVTLADRIVIADNQVGTADAALDVRAASRVAILRNLITDTLSFSRRGASGVGIQAIGVVRAVVDGNSVTAPDQAGAHVLAAAILSSDCSSLVIESNELADARGSGWEHRSVSADGDPYLVFSRNRLRRIGGIPIRIATDDPSTPVGDGNSLDGVSAAIDDLRHPAPGRG